jgi:hypothetical protein
LTLVLHFEQSLLKSQCKAYASKMMA